VIQLEHVTKTYPKASRPSLDDVSVGIEKGEFVFFIGPSGSGKSTIIKLLLHEIRPSRGKVVVNSRDVTAMRSWKIPTFRRSIGCVFQDFRLLPNRTAYENVAFALEVIGKTKAVARRVVPEVLELVGLGGKEHRYPHELSGGEQQRVAVARAFVNRPLILLADEPTGNLDPDTSIEIMRLLDRINPDQPHRHDRGDGHPRLQHRQPDAPPGRRDREWSHRARPGPRRLRLSRPPGDGRPERP
jgi:cell division transport system ATP-binding protein